MSFFERLKTEASAEWRAYTEHLFTTGMADGTLTEPTFRHDLVQDYLFLIEFARAYAPAVYKSLQLFACAPPPGSCSIHQVAQRLH